MKVFSFEPLLAWFAIAKRSFPWRDNVEPYEVLVSEVMLQQTQASRVVGYYERWMELFPTIQTLAMADEEQVIKAWEGLGYYSRARSLHRCARYICTEYDGVVPDDKEELLELPGIGPYTAGAILAFAYHRRAAAVDANVRRVMSRLVEKFFETGSDAIVEQMLPQKNPWVAMEGLIELGALICTKNPDCERCPCTGQCYGYATNQIALLSKSTTVIRKTVWRDVTIFMSQGSVLLKKSSKKALMRGLYEFPYFESEAGGRTPDELLKKISNVVLEPVSILFPLTQERHSFTQYQAFLYPTVISVKNFFYTMDECVWIDVKKLTSLPFSSGHRRVLIEFLQKLV